MSAFLRQPLFQRGLTTALLLVSLLYLVRGCQYYLDHAADLHLRWVEQQYILRGKNPQAASRRLIEATPAGSNAATSAVEPDLGPTGGGYPPWFYFVGATFLWPPNWAFAKVWFAAWNLGALVLAVGWAYRVGRAHSREAGWLLAAAFLGIRSLYTTWGNGQLGILVLGALATILLWGERRRDLLVGVALAFVMTKPTLGAPFLLPFLFQWRLRPLLITGALLGVGALAVAAWVGTNPLAMLNGTASNAAGYVLKEVTLITAFHKLGFAVRTSVLLSAATVGAAGAFLIWQWRASGLLVQFAIAGVTSIFWTYHHDYDNLILAFLLVALFRTAWNQKGWLPGLAFLAVGASLWPPNLRGSVGMAQEAAQFLTWIGALAVLLVSVERRSTAPVPAEPQPALA